MTMYRIRFKEEAVFDVEDVSDTDAFAKALSAFRDRTQTLPYPDGLYRRLYRLEHAIDPARTAEVGAELSGVVLCGPTPVPDPPRADKLTTIHGELEREKFNLRIKDLEAQVTGLQAQLALAKDISAEAEKTIGDFSDHAITENPELASVLITIAEQADILDKPVGYTRAPCWPWCCSWPSDNSHGSACSCNASEVRAIIDAAKRAGIEGSRILGCGDVFSPATLLEMETSSFGGTRKDNKVVLLEAEYMKLIRTAKLVRAHQFETHTSCDKQNCVVCEGGLAICVVCGQAEVQLEAVCPGPLRQMLRGAGDALLKYTNHAKSCDKGIVAHGVCSCKLDEACAEWQRATDK